MRISYFSRMEPQGARPEHFAIKNLQMLWTPSARHKGDAEGEKRGQQKAGQHAQHCARTARHSLVYAAQGGCRNLGRYPVKRAAVRIRRTEKNSRYSLVFLMWHSAAMVAPRPRKKNRKSMSAPSAVNPVDENVTRKDYLRSKKKNSQAPKADRGKKYPFSKRLGVMRRGISPCVFH